MSAKPETQFICGVHKYLPSDVHHEKMNNPYRGGTADVWYSALGGDLWVEYKFLPRLPQRGAVTPALSDLQKHWLRGRHEEGRTVAVVVGCPSGGIILQSPAAWERAIKAEEFSYLLKERKLIAAWIAHTTKR